MLNYNDVNENREVSTPEEMCLTSQYRFAFDKKKGWIQTTRSGNRVYANRHVGHGRVLGGANDFARVNARDLRSAEKFPVNPEGISDTVLYHCLRHDYVFFPRDFTDTNGVQRKHGYYDEEANYHEKIRILYYPKSGGAVCGYCGHHIIFDVNEQDMDDIWCTECGAEINYMNQLDSEYDFLVWCQDAFAYAFDVDNQTEIFPKEELNIEYTKTLHVYEENREKIRFITTRQFESRPIKEWKPNKKLIVESNINHNDEGENIKSLDYNSSSFRFFDKEARDALDKKKEEEEKRLVEEERKRKEEEQNYWRRLMNEQEEI